jgi:hypothetical protein
LGVLYVVSAEEAAGKTAVCAGLGINFLNAGKTVGYLKPQATEKGADGDIAFMKQALGVADIVNAPDMIKGRDIVIVEAMIGPKVSDTKATMGAVREMRAKVIAVEAYTGQNSKYSEAYRGLGESFLGVVINKVPASQLKSVKEKAAARFTAANIKLLGVIPENRVLMAISIGELADVVKGKILNSPDKSGELVENFMLGAMVLGSGINYFERKKNKAAIIRQDRPDMQLAALETSMRCLVLCGGTQAPIFNVTQKAESSGVPIISTAATPDEIVTGIEEALFKARMRQEKKLTRLAETIKQNLDLKAITV